MIQLAHVVVDTSVWVDHFKGGNEKLVNLLDAGAVLLHPFVLGELACGTPPERSKTLAHLRKLPVPQIASTDEVLALIEERQLMDCGLGWVDVHLVASSLLSRAALLTLDKCLSDTIDRLVAEEQNGD